MSQEILQYALAFSAVAGPIIAAVSAALAHGARLAATETAGKVGVIEHRIDGRMDELLVLTRASAEARGRLAGVIQGTSDEVARADAAKAPK